MLSALQLTGIKASPLLPSPWTCGVRSFPSPPPSIGGRKLPVPLPYDTSFVSKTLVVPPSQKWSTHGARAASFTSIVEYRSYWFQQQTSSARCGKRKGTAAIICPEETAYCTHGGGGQQTNRLCTAILNTAHLITQEIIRRQ